MHYTKKKGEQIWSGEVSWLRIVLLGCASKVMVLQIL